MDPRKALESDGLSRLFYYENWSVVGKDVLSLYKKVLNEGKSVREFNDTFVVLIPKIPKPKGMTNYRPISLCRVVYKIMAKVWANRLKMVLPHCISHNQSAFVPSRMIHDNFIIAHELVHYLQSAKNGPNKGFVAKLDMSKAYNRMEWPFLERVMFHLSFDKNWV